MLDFVLLVRFIPNFAEVSASLDDLTRKEFATRARFKKAWGKRQDTAFAHVRRLLVSAPVLKLPGYEREYIVHVEASKIRVDALFAHPSRLED